jgi:hypothetical protein
MIFLSPDTINTHTQDSSPDTRYVCLLYQEIEISCVCVFIVSGELSCVSVFIVSGDSTILCTCVYCIR